MKRVIATVNAKNKYEAIVALKRLLKEVKKYDKDAVVHEDIIERD